MTMRMGWKPIGGIVLERREQISCVKSHQTLMRQSLRADVAITMKWPVVTFNKSVCEIESKAWLSIHSRR